MDLLIASRLQKSYLLPSSKSSDHVIRSAENKKFRNDQRSTGPIQNSATRRLIPLAHTTSYAEPRLFSDLSRTLSYHQLPSLLADSAG
jgi:hypothetical protein